MGTDEYTKVQLILFLNKCDILERKLARGVSLKRYIPSYGDRKNDLPTASKCAFIFFSTNHIFSFSLSSMRHKALKKTFVFFFGYVHVDLRNQFLEIARKQSPEPRTVHSFMTTAIVRTLPALSFFYYSFYFLAFFLTRVIVQDTRAMAKTLGAIRGSILNDNLQSAELLR